MSKYPPKTTPQHEVAPWAQAFKGDRYMSNTSDSVQRPNQEVTSSLSPGDRRVLNENELAQRWGLSPKTLQRWRTEGRGPRYLKLSKRVGYPIDSVIDFERWSLHESTSERSAR